MMQQRQVCRVGYALNPKKMRKSSKDSAEIPSNSHTEEQQLKKSVWRGGGLSDILDNKSENFNGVKLLWTPWDPDLPVHKQPVFDVIIHKLTEDIESDDPVSRLKLIKLQEYLTFRPSTAIVDPIQSVRKVTSRARTCECLQSIYSKLGEKSPFMEPKFLVVEDYTSDERMLQHLRDATLSFPIICKPLLACGNPCSHNMVVIVSETDVGMMSSYSPCVVQPYYDHDARLFKVYVLDDDVMAFERNSLPNLDVISHQDLTAALVEQLQCIPVAPVDLHHNMDVEQAFDDLQLRPTTTSTVSSIAEELTHDDLHASRVNELLETFTVQSVRFDSRQLYPVLRDFVCFDQAKLQECRNRLGATANRRSALGGEVLPATANDANNNSSAKSRDQESVQATPVLAVHMQQCDNANTCDVHDNKTRVDGSDLENWADYFTATARALQAEFGLTLFGFDCILPLSPVHDAWQCGHNNSSNGNSSNHHSSNNASHIGTNDTSSQTNSDCSSEHNIDANTAANGIVVIDVNFFPSYKEVSDFPDRLRNILCRKARLL